MSGQRIDLNKCSLQELQDLHRQLTADMDSFNTNYVALQQTAGKFATAGQAVEGLKEKKQGQPVLLPMTEALYVSGTLDSVESVLLEIGTGYYIEKDMDGGVDYCKRKVQLVKKNLDQLSDIMQSRQAAMNAIEDIAAEKQQAS